MTANQRGEMPGCISRSNDQHIALPNAGIAVGVVPRRCRTRHARQARPSRGCRAAGSPPGDPSPGRTPWRMGRAGRHDGTTTRRRCAQRDEARRGSKSRSPRRTRDVELCVRGARFRSAAAVLAGANGETSDQANAAAHVERALTPARPATPSPPSDRACRNPR
jgi:hypothetical protein